MICINSSLCDPVWNVPGGRTRASIPWTDIQVLTRNQRLAARLAELSRALDAEVIRVDSVEALRADAGMLIVDLAHEQATTKFVRDLQIAIGEPLPLIIGVPVPEGPPIEDAETLGLDGLLNVPLSAAEFARWLRLARRFHRLPRKHSIARDASDGTWLGSLIDAETTVGRARVLMQALLGHSGRHAGVVWLPDNEGIEFRTVAVEGLPPGLVPERVSAWSLAALSDGHTDSSGVAVSHVEPASSMLIDRLMTSVGATDAELIEINRRGQLVAVVMLTGGVGNLDMRDEVRQLCRRAATLIDQSIQIERAEAHAARVAELERQLPTPLMLIDQHGNILQANSAAASLTGYDVDDLLLMRLHDLIATQDLDARFDELLHAETYRDASRGVETTDVRIRGRAVDASPATLHIWPSSRRDPEAGWLANVLISAGVSVTEARAGTSTAQPVPEREQAAEILDDPVTGLPDRRAVLAWIEAAIAAAPSEPLSVLMVGIDRFKKVNDTYGYRVGDALLVQVGETLRNHLPSEAYLGRFASDEFVLAYPNVGREDIYAVAESVRIAVATQLYMADDQLEQLTVSIGAATFPDDAANVQQIMLATNHAMRLAKQAGRNHVYQSNAAFSELAAHHSRLTDLLRQAPRETLALLVKAMDQRLPERAGHAQRVARFAVAMAECLARPRIDALRVAALVHDIGMFALPDSVLRKPIHLSDGERRMLNRIPEMAERLLSQIDLPISVAPAVVHQHEHWDGSGRPAGLAGDQIPIEARIIAVADALDALTSDRAHRRALPIEEALEMLRRSSETQFDPAVVEAAHACLGVDAIQPLDANETIDAALRPVAD